MGHIFFRSSPLIHISSQHILYMYMYMEPGTWTQYPVYTGNPSRKNVCIFIFYNVNFAILLSKGYQEWADAYI
jgi:hypothetical protein